MSSRAAAAHPRPMPGDATQWEMPPGRMSVATGGRRRPRGGGARSTARRRGSQRRSWPPPRCVRIERGRRRSARCRAARSFRCGSPAGCNRPRARQGCGPPSRSRAARRVVAPRSRVGAVEQSHDARARHGARSAEERHVMSSADQRLRERADDRLHTTVPARRHWDPRRSEHRDTQRCSRRTSGRTRRREIRRVDGSRLTQLSTQAPLGAALTASIDGPHIASQAGRSPGREVRKNQASARSPP
jgi:hypothetical protein